MKKKLAWMMSAVMAVTSVLGGGVTLHAAESQEVVIAETAEDAEIMNLDDAWVEEESGAAEMIEASEEESGAAVMIEVSDAEADEDAAKESTLDEVPAEEAVPEAAEDESVSDELAGIAAASEGLIETVEMVELEEQDAIELLGGTEEEGSEDTGTITSIVPTTSFSTTGYYPATFQYVMANMNFKVTFEDGTYKYLRGWYSFDGEEYYNEEDWGYYSEDSSYTRYYARFYQDDTQVKLTKDCVPIGDLTMKISRGDEDPVYTTTIKILDIDSVIGSVSGSTASFASSSYSTYDESWYAVPTSLDGTYIYSASDWNESNYFASLWKKEGSAVVRVNEGKNNSYESSGSFQQEYDGTQDSLYLVIGEMYGSTAYSGNVSWQQKKEAASIKINAFDSYKGWNGDIEDTPITITYTDGTTETVYDWGYSSSFTYTDESGNTNWVSGYSVSTANVDEINIGMYDTENETWAEAYGYSKWKPGSTTWIAYLSADSSIRDEAVFTIPEPSVTTLPLEKNTYDSFSISSGNEAYYTFTTTEAVTIEVDNSTAQEMGAYVYRRTSGDETWSMKSGSLVSASKSRNLSFDAGYEYLVILETDYANTGTIGVYTAGTANSAEVKVSSVDIASAVTWSTLPVEITFADEEGTELAAKQTISSWYLTSSSSGMTYAYAYSKYSEKIVYELWQGSTQVSLSSSMSEEEMAEILLSYGIDPSEMDAETMEKYLEEIGYSVSTGGADIEAGDYTVKIYKDSSGTQTLLGTSTITVTDSSAENGGSTGGSGTGSGSTTGGSSTGSGSTTGGSSTGSGSTTGGSDTGSGSTTGGSSTGSGSTTDGSSTGGSSTESGSTGSMTEEDAIQQPELSLPGDLSSVTIKKGKTVKFTPVILESDSVKSVVSSKTAYVKVVKVNKSTGEITLKGLKKGSSKITITLASGFSKTYKFTVTTGTVKTKSVALPAEEKTLTLEKGKKYQLNAELKPFSSSQKITYKSSNTKIAKVSSTGKITAVNPGKATITIKSGSKKTTCTVTVNGIGNVKSSITLKKGKRTILKPKLYGVSGTVTYKSSKKSVAAVKANGRITAKKKGKATITLKVGSYTWKCKVTVK